MTTTVHELTGMMRHIESDNELIFPNVLSCVAVVAVINGAMVGVHVTFDDSNRMSKIAEEVKTRGDVSDVYVVGPVEHHNVSLFVHFGGTVHVCDTPGGIDVRAQMMTGGSISFEKRPTNGHAWEAIPLASFS